MNENPYNIRVFRKIHHNVYYVAFGKGKNIMRINSLEEQRFGNLKCYCEDLKKFSHSLKAKLCSKKSAFTLAELIITLTIISIVVILLLPKVFENIHEREYSVARKKALIIIGEAGRQIAIDGNMNSASNANEFVNKYLKEKINIIKTCTPSEFKECGLPEKIKVINASNSNQYKEIYMPKNGPGLSEYIPNTNSYGFVLNNGYSVDLFYNPNCTANVTSIFTATEYKFNVGSFVCINAIYDMNGKKKPNTATNCRSTYNKTIWKITRFV